MPFLSAPGPSPQPSCQGNIRHQHVLHGLVDMEPLSGGAMLFAGSGDISLEQGGDDGGSRIGVPMPRSFIWPFRASSSVMSLPQSPLRQQRGFGIERPGQGSSSVPSPNPETGTVSPFGKYGHTVVQSVRRPLFPHSGEHAAPSRTDDGRRTCGNPFPRRHSMSQQLFLAGRGE